MDTKWKNKKKGISFIIFFAGVSLTIYSCISLLQNLPADFSWRHPNQAIQDDYQQSSRFRGYISSCLETFLAMATDSFGGNYYDYYDYYSDYGYARPGSFPGGTATVIQESVVAEDKPEVYLYQEPGGWGRDLQGLYDYLNYLEERYGDLQGLDDLEDLYDGLEDRYGNWRNWNNSLTDEQREELLREQHRKLAKRYHEKLKQDENLLYSIACDGTVLYANWEQPPADDSMALPERYNFLLQYADGRVRIFKDGQELDVYGDGYYREDSQWYVPGYKNFLADEEMKKAVIYIAAAREPVLYSESSYTKGSYRQMDNSLYWMRYNLLARREILLQGIRGLAVGLILLVMAFLCRKSRREADESISRFTGKIWFEGKILFAAVILFLVLRVGLNQIYWYGDSIVRELYWITEAASAGYGYDFSALGVYMREVFLSVPALMWIVLFWLVYMVVNDMRHNRKVWQHGLIAKFYRVFASKDISHPFPVKIAHRNAAAFAAAAIYGVLMLAGGINGYMQNRWNSRGSVWGMGSLFFLIMVGFLAMEYLIGRKNMETARDMETLANRIRDIRNGDYKMEGKHSMEGGHSMEGNQAGEATGFAGHDLHVTMAQLEDIRHGMANAVDEQMKSERMKVELIANVSHDIKTPLTSIISYVQFLKEEKGLPEHVQDYVKILDEKSQRLKNMVQDVFAMSKAASGDLPMHMEELDFGKLLCQTLADMEEQIAGSNITFRTQLPDMPVMIMADGQRMYRVFQNLFQNAIQYSLEGSRVFIILQVDGSLAVASVKNISHQELEEDKDFTERFTRGDQSRTDGGSGLGLSIAKSFTEACGGQFRWETNADLFVVTVAFRIAGEKK